MLLGIGGGVALLLIPFVLPGSTPILIPAASAALTISSSRTWRAAQMTAHSTMSSLPSPSVFHTAFSSSVLPVIVTRVPPPVMGLPSGPKLLEMCPNWMRFGGMRSVVAAARHERRRRERDCQSQVTRETLCCCFLVAKTCNFAPRPRLRPRCSPKPCQRPHPTQTHVLHTHSTSRSRRATGGLSLRLERGAVHPPVLPRHRLTAACTYTSGCAV